MSLITIGGGCRGSIISTLYMIGLTLLFALPLGIGCAIYLQEYAKENKISRAIKNLIVATSGIPSIIFGLAGAIIFIPIVNSTAGSNGGSIISGALTLSAMLLPVIVSNTEAAIKAMPTTYKPASLALGASQSQTTFKVILPGSLPGILTGTLLSVRRIIGESAALIYASGIPKTTFAFIFLNHSIFSLFGYVFCTTFLYFYIKYRLAKTFSPIKLQLKKLGEYSDGKLKLNSIDDIVFLQNYLIKTNRLIKEKIKTLINEKTNQDYIINSIPQGLIVINNEGKIILINKSSEQILSTSLQLAKSKPLVNFFIKKEVLDIVDKAKNQNISVYKEYKSGNNRDYKINIYSLYNEAGNDVCLVFNDVTQEKILSKSKRDFFANASHELKSPLTTIKGYIQLIKENIITDDKEKARTFERVISEANRMNNIIIQMLDLSKLEVTKPIISEEISCLEMVDEACSMLEKKILDKAISLKISGSDFKIKLMREDALSLVKNIVENAILYNKQNGIININLNQNTLSISDTGIGTPVKYQKRIFERFFRVDKAKSRKMGGTGLGLSIVKHICINYNLHLKLKSQLNIGTCITVDF